MAIRNFSHKQREVLTWWCEGSRWREREAVICDGAVRSGKTLCCGLSFFCWAMRSFSGQRFALCGKTAGGVRRNLLGSVLPLLREIGFQCWEKVSRNELWVRFGGRENCFFLFGGKDEGSAALIQGVTLAGVLLDEVTLMPRSFVEQACARCSVPRSRLWFNCNPEGPGHWFYREWIEKREERRALYLHFTMGDNPGLTPEILERYERLYTGTFYRRFVLGEWTAAEGTVYDFFGPEQIREPPENGEMEEWCISCDYGTVNPASFGLWGRKDGVWYRVREFYYDSKKAGRQKTDREYAADLADLAGERNITCVVVDPSAASFLETLRQEGWRVIKGENEVLWGIRTTAEMLRSGRLVIGPECRDSIREFGLYRWDTRAPGDRVRKEFDHAMDDIRYFAALVKRREQNACLSAGYVERSVF